MTKTPPREALTLAAAMNARRLSKVFVADQLGVTPAAVSQWASGHRPVPPEKAVKLADVVGTEPHLISARYAELQTNESGNVVPIRQAADGADERRNDLVIARLENDVDSLRYALGALVTVMTVHRPAEGAAVAKAIRKHVPVKFVKQGYVAELLGVLDKAGHE
ncbi:MAG: helix-turn-helix transcriptional regulator [Luteibacter sp.]|uniref:helix-turn-helix transcriptional regulator n=1 Tax=Luteibacter sp. TaxID=1886636 RepID=UPI002809301A|nr:helix-turn-helix transcriptional regulator [Luteibacter sp.]MDQ7996094.1 helix-turn-helix transcriptional regulator [Luteibacter sp.]